MTEEQQIPGIDMSTTHLSPRQRIRIEEIPDGSVIDIGGGGEGVIGQIGGKRITSIDKRESEIEEAREKAPDANFVLADATELPFEDEKFDAATSFFTGMYMPEDVLNKSIKETYRVIKKGGEFWFWDSVLYDDKELYLIQMDYILPDGTVRGTGYGTRRFKDQTAETTKKRLESAGFTVEIIESHDYWYFMKAKK